MLMLCVYNGLTYLNNDNYYYSGVDECNNINDIYLYMYK